MTKNAIGVMAPSSSPHQNLCAVRRHISPLRSSNLPFFDGFFHNVPAKIYSLFLLTVTLAISISFSLALFADYATVPKGTNPTLYDATDFVIQLDEQTFNDTVFCWQPKNTINMNNENGNGNADDGQQRCTSLVVEFYSDWCGHCRAYARVYKALAKDLLEWSNVIKMAAINCADPINLMTCRSSGITHYPFIKYFPRNSSAEAEDGMDGSNVGQLLPSYQSMAAMRDQFTRSILEEYEQNRYEDWPDFDWLSEVETYGQLWDGVPDRVQTMVVIFETSSDSLMGAKFILDLSKFADKIIARRCSNNALANALQVHDLPSFAIFRRGQRSPVHISDLRHLLFNEFEQFLHNESALLSPASSSSHSSRTFARRRGATSNHDHFCRSHPQICRRAYFVSELDMLKSIRIALFQDIHLSGHQIAGQNLTALFNFVDLLANNFPYSSSDVEGDGGGQVQFLNASSRARVVFSHLRDFIESRAASDGTITVDNWRAEFQRAEIDQQNPFPIADQWEHCKGTSPLLRGFTCGLWMVFHAITVNSYKNEQSSFHPISVLHTIRDWVGAFFGCEHCRHHFLKMTTKLVRIEATVRRKEDVFLYLWRAHNLVNARLKGRETEDPQFPKYQFPPRFLCEDCRRLSSGTAGEEGNNGTEEFDEEKVKQFMLTFYSNVRPINDREVQRVSGATMQQRDDEEKNGEKTKEEEEKNGKGEEGDGAGMEMMNTTTERVEGMENRTEVPR